jgi:hypothetical protein
VKMWTPSQAIPVPQPSPANVVLPPAGAAPVDNP